MKPGEIVFFRKAKSKPMTVCPAVEFKGHGYGIFLGHVPYAQPEPPPVVYITQLGSIGFISFDDVNEFLGDEAAVKCVQKFEEKYYEKKAPGPVLVSEDGKPMGTINTDDGTVV
jgi:hypothetical protein